MTLRAWRSFAIINTSIIRHFVNNKNTTLNGGSLGSWVDEERSKLRVKLWTAGHMNIDNSNAYCGPWILFLDHSWLRVVSIYTTVRIARWLLSSSIVGTWWRIVKCLSKYAIVPVYGNHTIDSHPSGSESTVKANDSCARMILYCVVFAAFVRIYVGPSPSRLWIFTTTGSLDPVRRRFDLHSLSTVH